MTWISRLLARLSLIGALGVVVGWPAVATVLEAVRAVAHRANAQPGTGIALDAAGSTALLRETGALSRPVRLAMETIGLVLMTETIALPLGTLLAFLLFRTDVWGRKILMGFMAVAAFVPLPLHATAWLGAFGNVGRAQAFGVRPFLVGRFGAAVVHALAALPWVVLIVGVGLAAVEPELEESALLEVPPWRVLVWVTLRRAIGAIAAAGLAVAVLTSGDMTVTDLLQVRTYAEEAFLQYTLGRGPGEAAFVTLPPLLCLGILILLAGQGLSQVDPARLVSSFDRSRVWSLRRWRFSGGLLLMALVGNLITLPLYSLIWRAGRVGGRATLGRPPTWSLSGLMGTLRFAAIEIWDPLQTSLLLTAVAATLATSLACALAWAARRSWAWRSVSFGTLALTLATPGPVAGMALVLAYRDVPPMDDSLMRIVLAETLRALPYALLLLWPVLRSFPQDYLDATALDGYGLLGQMFHVVLPLSRRALMAAWAITFAIGLSELPATNLVMPAGVLTMSFFIWSLLHTGVDSHLAGVALIMLMVVATAGLLAASAIRSLRDIARP
jgi:iron(III) transport system permease protein